MNDKDKEAFENWYSEENAEKLWEDSNGDEVVTKAWQAACEYKDKEFINGSRMKQMNDRIEDLITENKKLRELIDDLVNCGMDNDIATRIETLKEDEDA